MDRYNDDIVENKSSPGKRIIDAVSNIFLLLGTCYSIVLIIDQSIVSTYISMKVYGLLGIVLLVKVFSSKKITNLGPAQILILYTVASSLGYDILVFFLGEEMYSQIASLRHSYMEYFNFANAVYYLGIVAMIYGMMTIKKTNDKNPEELKEYLSVSDLKRDLYMKIAFATVSIYAVIIIFSVITGRLPLTNYGEVRDWFATQPLLSYLLRLTWVMIPTYFYFAEKKTEYIKFCIPVGFMFIILMITGNRNEILYPLAIAVGVFVWKRYHLEGKKTLPKYVTIGSLLIVFVLNPLISSTRQSGLNVQTLLSGSFGFKDAFLELGQQLNPFSIILSAMDDGITSFRYGMTYIVPSISLLSLNLVFGTSYYLTSMKYNPTVVLNSLGHYGRGFSYIAELYMNFGTIGVLLCMFLLGRYMGKCENATFRNNKLLFYFQIMPFFMIISRNICGFSIVTIIFAVILNMVVGTRSIRMKKGRLI